MTFRTLPLLTLFVLASCKGTRFYWESSLVVPDFSEKDRKELVKKFDLTSDLTNWHPVYGRYCTGLKSHLAHLFVCLKNHELRIISSYPGILKGDEPVNDNASTINKYLASIADFPGFQEHSDIKAHIEQNFRVGARKERLLTYGKGSLIIKDELSDP